MTAFCTTFWGSFVIMKMVAALVLLLCNTVAICRASGSEGGNRYRCIPQTREPCSGGQESIRELSIVSAEGPYQFGPFVCKYYEREWIYAHSYVYEGRDCQYYWYNYRYYYYCRSYECVKTNECYYYSTLNSFYDCCPGFVIDSRFNQSLPDSDEYQQALRRQGCPPMRQDFVRTCLDVLNLTELTQIINSTDPITTPVIELTLFAPSNEALVEAQTTEDLEPSFLASHIVLTEYHAAKFVNGLALDGAISGTRIHFTTVNDEATHETRIFASGAEIIQKDACFANNGVVHIINGIITTDPRSVAEIISTNDSLTVFYNLLRTSGMIQYLEYEQLRTVFAPTDAAFRALIEDIGLDVVACLLDPSNVLQLENYLLYHVAAGAEYSSTLALRDTLTTKVCRSITCNGNDCIHKGCLELTIKTRGEEIIVVGDTSVASESLIQTADVPGSNGVIHSLSLPLISPQIDFQNLCAAFPF